MSSGTCTSMKMSTEHGGYSLPFSPVPLSPQQPASPALFSAAPEEPDVFSPTPGFLAQSFPSSYPQTSLS